MVNKNVSNPKLWERVKKEAIRKYAKDGRWNARVAQQAVRMYKKRGGKYKTPKSKKRNSGLAIWSKEQWSYHSSDKNKTGRYLPKAIWKKLTSEQIKTTNRNKRKGSREGKKYIPYESFVNKWFRQLKISKRKQ